MSFNHLDSITSGVGFHPTNNNHPGNEEKDDQTSVASSSATESESELSDMIPTDLNPVNAMIEICGLTETSNGRTCNMHECCGITVVVNDTLRLKRCLVEVNGFAEEAIKLVKLSWGSETCTVGFLPRIYYNLPKVQQNINKNVQVVKLYKEGNSYEKQKDRVNAGMATCVFINDIPIEE